MSVSKSGGHDRRGFDTLLKFFLICIPCSLVMLVVYEWKIGLTCLLLSCMSFITLEAISARPDNNPTTFLNWLKQHSDRRRRPVLLCLGDSLMHGNCSASITPEIPLKLTQQLGLPLAEYGKTFADPLYVVNAGQNNITSHVLLKEPRLQKTLNVFPDYICLLIGTNDVRAIYKKTWQYHTVKINELSCEELPSMSILERNLTQILDFIRTASPQVQIGICTLPPMGEKLVHSRANDLVRQANEVIERVVEKAKKDDDRIALIPVFAQMESILEKKRRRLWSWSVDWFWFIAMIQNPIFHIFFSNWNVLSSLFGFYLLSDGLHLNERGRDVVVDLIVEWLIEKNIAKAIAVKK